MKKILLIFALVSFCWSVSAQQQVKADLSDFTTLKLQGNLEVTIVPADKNTMEAELKDLQPDKFEWSVTNGVLSVRIKTTLSIGKDLPKPFAKVTVYYKQIKELDVSGATLLNKGALKGDMIKIVANSKADVALEVVSKDLTVEASNAKATISGKTDYLKVKSQVSASVNTITMICQNANILTTSNAECYATAIKRFEAKATTNSNIFYKGAPEIVQVSTATLGNIEAF